jgi:hypothetical protein
VQTVIIICLIAALSLYLIWGIRVLPGERWQFLAAVPLRKNSRGEWEGVNLTWYGLLTANAYVVAVAVLFLLMGAVGVPVAGSLIMAVAMLAVCVPASRLVARLVEKKAHTFTVGGAVFVGVLAAPWVVLAVDRLMGPAFACTIAPSPALAAIAVAYAFGEGLGRLACISFGCCYGKRLTNLSPLLWNLFSGCHFVFYGKTRKIAYAGDMEGEPVVPVQALTAVLYVACGLAGMGLFFSAHYATAFLVTMIITQGWRFLSETLRDDYRGGGRISVYQVMGLTSILYGGAAFLLMPASPVLNPDFMDGLALFREPALIISIQLLWAAIFLYTGRSTVTGATLSFHVHRERI